MNLTQLRYLRGIAEQGFNISRAAAALHTSQPGISKQIQLLEREIGVEILVRRGNRIVGVTDAAWAARKAAWRAPALKATSGTLYKYIKCVSDASHGCVTDL